MQSTGFQIPSRIVYFWFLFLELIEVLCRILLSYSLMILIIFLPVTTTALQLGGGLIEQPLVSQATRSQFAQEVRHIIIDGNITAVGFRAFTEEEISHLIDVRRVFLTVVIVSIVCAVILLYLRLNNQRAPLFHRSRLFWNAAMIIGLFTFLTAVLFPYFFGLFHLIVFPQGNFMFSDRSALIEAYPLPFWLLAYIFLQLGVLILLIAQAIHAQRQEV